MEVPVITDQIGAVFGQRRTYGAVVWAQLTLAEYVKQVNIAICAPRRAAVQIETKDSFLRERAQKCRIG